VIDWGSSPLVGHPDRNEKFMKDEYDFSKGKRGPIRSNKGKTRITIYIDDDILEAYRVLGDESGRGYQTLINAALRETIKPGPKPLDAKTLRRILREELRKFAAAQL
jgi:uncharacterized protein (DUF4415 family)